jgi:hypothetical protein
MKVPASITFDSYNLYVDGVSIGLSAIPQVLYEFAHPDPRKWFRFERRGDTVFIHVKMSEEEKNGHPIAHTGRSEEGTGGDGKETNRP